MIYIPLEVLEYISIRMGACQLSHDSMATSSCIGAPGKQYVIVWCFGKRTLRSSNTIFHVSRQEGGALATCCWTPFSFAVATFDTPFRFFADADVARFGFCFCSVLALVSLVVIVVSFTLTSGGATICSLVPELKPAESATPPRCFLLGGAVAVATPRCLPPFFFFGVDSRVLEVKEGACAMASFFLFRRGGIVVRKDNGKKRWVGREIIAGFGSNSSRRTLPKSAPLLTRARGMLCVDVNLQAESQVFCERGGSNKIKPTGI